MPTAQRPSTTAIRSNTPSTIRTGDMAMIDCLLKRGRSAVCRESDDGRDGTIYNAVDCFQPQAQGTDVVSRVRIFSVGVAAMLACSVAARAQTVEPFTPA